MNMIEVKTAGLEGAALDWALGQAFKLPVDRVKELKAMGLSNPATLKFMVAARMGDTVSVPAEMVAK
jgi:hypothetical protein